jgi:hypothetical protein
VRRVAGEIANQAMELGQIVGERVSTPVGDLVRRVT